MRRSPIDALIDKACGYTGENPAPENTEQADAERGEAVAALADAAVLWLDDPSKEQAVRDAAAHLRDLGWYMAKPDKEIADV